ncbi:MAG: HdeD family acid-resistance protein [Rhizobiales bacterium]|nr:HdeD family acid-resistance protein [Hyphomicrobiales bacterium]
MTATDTDRHGGLGPGSVMLHGLARNWWLLLLRGLAGIVFGVLAFIWPGLTLLTLIILYGVYAISGGVFAIGAAVMGGAGAGSRWWLALMGLCGIIAGLLTFMWPGITALVLLVFIAASAIVTGVMEIIGAIQLRKEIDNEWWLILSGALSVLFGLAVLAMPGAGALALVWLIGAYAIADGIIFSMLGLKLKGHKHTDLPTAAAARS